MCVCARAEKKSEDLEQFTGPWKTGDFGVFWGGSKNRGFWVFLGGWCFLKFLVVWDFFSVEKKKVWCVCGGIFFCECGVNFFLV